MLLVAHASSAAAGKLARLLVVALCCQVARRFRHLVLCH